MNVNDKIIKLEEITGYPVQPDKYNGQSNEYITFNYSDERSVLFADDVPLEDAAYMQIHIFLGINTDYMELKDKIREYLENIGACDIASSVLTEETTKHIIFEFTLFEGRS